MFSLTSFFCRKIFSPSFYKLMIKNYQIVTKKFRCAASDPTVDIYSNGETHKSRFKFQMFKWRWSADPIYLHCEVDICNKTIEQCLGDAVSTPTHFNAVFEFKLLGYVTTGALR